MICCSMTGHEVTYSSNTHTRHSNPLILSPELRERSHNLPRTCAAERVAKGAMTLSVKKSCWREA